MALVKSCLSLLMFIVAMPCFFLCGNTDHRITFFIKPYPELLSSDAEKNFLTKNTIWSHEKRSVEEIVNSYTAFAALLKTPYPFSTAGIIALYAGYMSVSDINGQITFPFITQRPDFLIVVTPLIKPVFMLGATIHHWELIPTLETQCYSIIRKQDSKTSLFYWDVQEAPLPKKNILPINSIVLLAKPSSIVVPSGITLTSTSLQLVLPSVYAYYQLNRVTPALQALRIKNFFGPIKELYKKYNENYYAKQITTRTAR